MLAAGFVWMLLLGPALSQPVPSSQGTAAPSDSPQSDATDPNYHLGPADVLTIRVLGVNAFKQNTVPWIEVTVSNSGKISLPYVGIINVAGMTAAQLELEIAHLLRKSDLVKDPQVTVGVQAYRSNTVYILGEVAQPGQYYMREEMHVLDLIALAMEVPTGGTMYLYRRVPVEEEGGAPTGETKLAAAIPIDIQQIAEGNRPDLNLKLQGGDILYVPFNRPNYFFVSGDVLNPGSFEMPPRRELSISEAIAFAGGPTRLAKASKGILVRYDEQGGRQELAVDFSAILEGRRPNFAVMPNDIIFIPGSHAKTFAQGFIRLIPNILLLGVW